MCSGHFESHWCVKAGNSVNTVVGCYLCNRSSHESFSQLNVPHSTVSGVMMRWRRMGMTATLQWNSKVTERCKRMLRHMVFKCCQLSSRLQTSKLHVVSRLAREQWAEMFVEWVFMAISIKITASAYQDVFDFMLPLCGNSTETANPASLSNISVWLQKIVSQRMVQNPGKHTSYGNPTQESWSCHNCK